MNSYNKASALALTSALFLSGCSGSSDINPYAKIFGTVCRATDQGIGCDNGELPVALVAVDDALELTENLVDQLAGVSESNPLNTVLPLGEITDDLTAALDQTIVAIDEQLVGALPDEVSGLVDQALVNGLANSLTAVVNLISPALPDDTVLNTLEVANNPTDISSTVSIIESSLVALQSELRVTALVELVDALTAASSDVDDPSAQLAAGLEGIAEALASGNPEALAEALQGLTEVAGADEVASLLESVGGSDDLLDINPEDLTTLGFDDALQAITGTIGNILGIAFDPVTETVVDPVVETVVDPALVVVI